MRGLKSSIAVPSAGVSCRTPQGVRGLKLPDDRYEYWLYASHPARGAWIEMFVKICTVPGTTVAPRKGCVD